MSQPPFPYNRIFDFESFSIVNPTTQQPGVQIEGELDAIKRTLDSTISRLSEIQRDDGFLRDSALDHTTVVTQLYNRLATLFSPTFLQIDQKIDLKSNIASPTFTGVVTIPANAVIVGFAKLASPDFTGVPTTPTPAVLSASQQIANAAFVTAADAVIKQWVIDNYLKLAGDRMDDNAVINWTSIVPATQYPAFYRNTDTNDISKDGVSLFGKYPKPFSAAMYSVTNRRETIVSQGSIELLEFTTPGVYPVGTPDTDAIWTEKGKIVIWSGESYDAFTTKTPRVNPLSGPHISFEDKDSFQLGLVPMIISSNGLQFPDGTYQSTRGLNIGEVQTQATNAANLAVTNLINGAPAALDTLKEIADSLANDADLAGTLTLAIAGKSDLGHTHAVSDISGLQDTLNNISLKEYDNFKTYVAGDVVLASNRIFKFNSTVGAAGYGPITHPSYWTEQSASASLAGYATEIFVTSQGYITSASWGSITGTLSNQTDLQTALNAKVNLSGGSMTGKLNCGMGAGGTAINIGVRQGGVPPTAPSGGDLWVQNSNFNFKDSYGVNQTAPNLGTVNTFTANQIISGTTDDPLLRLTQTGTGNVLVVQDSANPDGTSFVINPNGVVGIGVTSVNGWGPTAGVVLDINGNVAISNGNLSVTNYGITAHTITTVGNGTFGQLAVSGSVNIASGTTGGVFTYIASGALASGQQRNIYIGTEGLSGSATQIHLGSANGNTSILAHASYGMMVNGNLSATKITGTPTSGYAGLNIGIGGVSTTALAPGDMWIATGGVNLNFRDGTGAWRICALTNSGNTFTQGQHISVNTSIAINPALRICQTGTAAALVVEDSTTPDTSSFVVNADGNVGIGVSNTGPSNGHKLQVEGVISATAITFDGVAEFKIDDQPVPHTGGSASHQMKVTIAGVQYYIELRAV